jgi:L-ascorbate metabolism protein UlaG (beta-lactamase superfamily)
MAILPIGAYEPRWFMGAVHMSPQDCIAALSQIDDQQKGTRLLVTASHWGTFKLTDEPMDEPPRLMRELWQVAGRNGDDLWIMRHGETRTVR